MNRITVILVLAISHWAVAQHRRTADSLERVTDSLYEQYFIFDEKDSVLRSMVELEPVIVFQPLKFTSREDRLRYYILRRKTLKVYPYSKLAAERLVALNQRLEEIDSKGDRRRYTRIVHRFLEEEFSEELKKLTRTEGQILIKLIHRQTGITTYELVRELRSGWKAFWYQNTASLFKLSLKEEYAPDRVEEDYLIEDILQRAFAQGVLKPQPTALGYDYASLTNKWKDTANVPKD